MIVAMNEQREARSKINPRWEQAPLERLLIAPPDIYIRDVFPIRYMDMKDAESGVAVPWFLVEQPDGSWKESF
jgi:hypothetical protein